MPPERRGLVSRNKVKRLLEKLPCDLAKDSGRMGTLDMHRWLLFWESQGGGLPGVFLVPCSSQMLSLHRQAGVSMFEAL